MDNQFSLDVVQAAEIKHAAARNGVTNADIKTLCGGDMFAKILPVLRGHAEIVFKSILSFLREVTIPASTERFIAREKFVVDTSNTAKVKIAWTGDNFLEHFLGKIEEAQCEVILAIHKLEKTSSDGLIRIELGRKREVTTLRSFFQLLFLQRNGQEGDLLTNGYANIFYIEDEDGNLRTVYTHWRTGFGGWNINADSVTNPDEWDAGFQVVSLLPTRKARK